jgi:hypothetical protein
MGETADGRPLKARVTTNEDDVMSIPDLIRTEGQFTRSQIARLSHDVAELQAKVGDLTGKVDALPRVVAELVVETLGDRKG